MLNLTSLLLRAFVALAFATGAGFASAGTVYQVSTFHVAIDTSAYQGQDGYLDFLFLGLGSAAPAQATVTNLTGDFDAADYVASNATGSLATGITIGNDTGWNEYAQRAHFGGLFQFDLQFNVANDPTLDGTTLSVALLDTDLIHYLGGTTGDMATFQLQPGQPDGLAASANTSVVSEPASLAQLVLGGGMLFGFLRRRRG